MTDLPSWLNVERKDKSSWKHKPTPAGESLGVQLHFAGGVPKLSATTDESTAKLEDIHEEEPITREDVPTSRAAVKEPPKATPRRVKETNKRLRSIYRDAGEDYGKDVDSVDALAERYKKAVHFRKLELSQIVSEIGRARNVQLCFLMDATGSMGPHIEGTMNAIDSIVEQLTTGPRSIIEHLEVAMVAYRDIRDVDPPRFEILPFTTNLKDFKAFCKSLKADGGADAPEDVLGGLDQALKVNWSDDFGTKVIFHMADYPCHGMDMHTLDKDDYPKGDPNGLNHVTLLKEIYRRNIDYHFGRITQWTQRMISRFSKDLGKQIEEFNVADAGKIRESVASSLTKSVTASVGRSVSILKKTPERIFRLVETEPAWDKLMPMKGSFMTYHLPTTIQEIIDDEPMQRKESTAALIKIARYPFGRGAERVAFFGQDVSEEPPEPLVLKEYLHADSNQFDEHERHNQMQTIAQFLTTNFSDNVHASMGVRIPIEFAKIKTLALSSSEAEYVKYGGLRFMSCELKFPKDTKFLRFSNNTDYSALEEETKSAGIDPDFVALLMAFSHWTYQVSDKNLMVVDLEGIITDSADGKGKAIQLTDPAIHCTDIARFGKMNLGQKGMDMFFSRHNCNKYCKRLGLTVEPKHAALPSAPVSGDSFYRARK